MDPAAIRPIILKDLFNIQTLEKLHWTPLRPGVHFHSIYGHPGRGPAAALLKYDAGAGLPRHEHTGYEHILVLAETQRDDHGDYPAGTLLVNPPGSNHRVTNPGGSIVLAIWEKPIVPVLEDR